MKLTDEEFALILSLARERAYTLFISGNEGAFNTWMWLRELEDKLMQEVGANEKEEEVAAGGNKASRKGEKVSS